MLSRDILARVKWLINVWECRGTFVAFPINLRILHALVPETCWSRGNWCGTRPRKCHMLNRRYSPRKHPADSSHKESNLLASRWGQGWSQYPRKAPVKGPVAGRINAHTWGARKHIVPRGLSTWQSQAYRLMGKFSSLVRYSGSKNRLGQKLRFWLVRFLQH